MKTIDFIREEFAVVAMLLLLFVFTGLGIHYSSKNSQTNPVVKSEIMQRFDDMEAKWLLLLNEVRSLSIQLDKLREVQWQPAPFQLPRQWHEGVVTNTPYTYPEPFTITNDWRTLIVTNLIVQ